MYQFPILELSNIQVSLAIRRGYTPEKFREYHTNIFSLKFLCNSFVISSSPQFLGPQIASQNGGQWGSPVMPSFDFRLDQPWNVVNVVNNKMILSRMTT